VDKGISIYVRVRDVIWTCVFLFNVIIFLIIYIRQNQEIKVLREIAHHQVVVYQNLEAVEKGIISLFRVKKDISVWIFPKEGDFEHVSKILLRDTSAKGGK